MLCVCVYKGVSPAQRWTMLPSASYRWKSDDTTPPCNRVQG